MVNCQSLNTSTLFLKPKFDSLKLTRIELSPDGWHLNILSPRLATITDQKGKRKVSYFGFATQEQALTFQQYIVAIPLATAATVRTAERLGTTWECKAWGVSTETILVLAKRLSSTTINKDESL